MAPALVEGTYVFRFGEKITISNADRLFADIEPHVLSDDVKRVVLDLENVIECSSYGLKLFLSLKRKAEGLGKTLLLYRPRLIILELLQSSKLDLVFTIVDSYE
jgi:anti-anti-sigma factor